MMSNIRFVIKNVLNHYAQNISYHLNRPICLPSVVHFAPTSRCNLRCKYCSIWKEGDLKRELSLDQWKNFLKDLSSWLGEAHIGITGGEPLLRKDIIDILHYMTSLHLKPSLTTNGILLNDRIIDKLSKLDIFNINISLESLDPKIHNFFRGEGSFERTLKNIFKLKEVLTKNNFRIILVIETTLTSKNLGTAEELLDFCKENGLKIHFGNVVEKLQVNYKGDFNKESEYKPKNNKKLDGIFSALIRKKDHIILNSTSELKMIRDYYKGKRIKFKCSAHSRNLFVNSDGSVKLCQYMPPVGNIKDKNIKKIWYSAIANKSRKAMRKCKKICQFDCYKKRNLFENYEMYKAMYSESK